MKPSRSLRSLLNVLVTLISLSVTSCAQMDAAEPNDEALAAEMKKLNGAWVEEHALAKEQRKGRGVYYTWVFNRSDVVREHTQTEDGIPLARSGLGGTFKLGVSAKPKAIDILLRTAGDEQIKYQGIYASEGSLLKLCISKEKRPTAFDEKDRNRLYLLRRIPKE